MKVAIVGCGLIGGKRAKFLGAHELVMTADTDLNRAQTLAQEVNGSARATTNWREATEHTEIDIIIVATTPDVMPEITLAAIKAGKHVLVEKPAARNYRELEPVAAAAREAGRCVHVGFNHRYHPALQQARSIVSKGEIGELMYLRGRYGHGGRLGYEQEWRAKSDISGGGELIDQGMHLIDLSRWFLGDFNKVMGHVGTYFWQMPVDDNAFAMLCTPSNQVAWLHVSWTEWKNTFSFEVFGKTGKLQIDGLGGSYGTETLTFYKMMPELGPPGVQRFEYAGPDLSWQLEFDEFVADIEGKRRCVPDLEDALAALKIVAELYAPANPVAGIFK